MELRSEAWVDLVYVDPRLSAELFGSQRRRGPGRIFEEFSFAFSEFLINVFNH